MNREQGLEAQSLTALLMPYRAQALAEATGTSRQVAHAWRVGEMFPSVRVLPALADFLRVDLAELTQMIARDAEAKR